MSIGNISSLAACVLLFLLPGCAPHPATGDGEGSGAQEIAESPRFDPLDLAQDLEVVPQPGSHDDGTPTSDGKMGSKKPDQKVQGRSAGNDVGDGFPDGDVRQVFKVQLFTSKLFGEAKQARKVAEEIFDQAVTLDYEVPYFKVRVGSFADRYEAEKYSQRAKAAGYGDAWVVATATSARRVAPIYNTDEANPDSVGTSEESGAGVD